MRYEYFRKRSFFALWSWKLAAFTAWLTLSVLVGYWFRFIEGRLLYAFLTFIALISFLGLLSAFWAFFDLWKYGDIAGWPAFLGIVLNGSFFLFALAGLWNSTQSAQDISTNISHPPQFIEPLDGGAEVTDGSSTPFVSIGSADDTQTQALTFWGRRYALPAATLSGVIITLLQKKQWPIFTKEVSEQQHKQFLIQTQSKLLFLSHLSDIIVRIIDEKGTTSYLDLRSLYSRGSPDLGLNKKLVADLLAEIEAEVINYQLNASDNVIILNTVLPAKE